MLFGKLLEGSNDADDNVLIDMEQQLRSGIEKAKAMANACKIINQAEDFPFQTTAAGVNAFLKQELLFPDFKMDVNYNEEFWKTYLKN